MKSITTPLSPESSLDTWKTVAALNNALYWDWTPLRMDQPALRDDTVWAADPGSLSPFPNSATVIREVAAEDVESVVGRLKDFYSKRAGGPWLLWSAWPLAGAERCGLQHLGCPPLMIRLTDQSIRLPQPDGLTIREVADSTGVRDWIHVVANGYPAPELAMPGKPPLYDERILGAPLRLMVGYVDGMPVSCSASFTDQNVSGLFAIATLPEFRRRGIGTALTAAVTSSDPLPAILTASDHGYRMYQSLGFREQFRFELWMGHRD